MTAQYLTHEYQEVGPHGIALVSRRDNPIFSPSAQVKPLEILLFLRETVEQKRLLSIDPDKPYDKDERVASHDMVYGLSRSRRSEFKDMIFGLC